MNTFDNTITLTFGEADKYLQIASIPSQPAQPMYTDENDDFSNYYKKKLVQIPMHQLADRSSNNKVKNMYIFYQNKNQ